MSIFADLNSLIIRKHIAVKSRDLNANCNRNKSTRRSQTSTKAAETAFSAVQHAAVVYCDFPPSLES